MNYNDIDKLQYTLLSELISTNYIEMIYEYHESMSSLVHIS